MKKLFALLLAAAMLLTLAACGTQNTDSGSVDEPKNDTAADTAPTPAEETPESTGSKVLIAYFSATGHTKAIAEHLQAALDADLYEIVPQEPYTAADLDYSADDCRANQEQNDDAARPAISGSVENMEGYDVVFIGYPIWWGKAPRIIDTFLESYDLSGKTLIPLLHLRQQQHRRQSQRAAVPDARRRMADRSAVRLHRRCGGCAELGGQPELIRSRNITKKKERVYYENSR